MNFKVRTRWVGKVRKVKVIIIFLALVLFAASNNQVAIADSLVKAPEHNIGYARTYFKLWIDADKDGCNTRAEVLIEEAILKPKVGKNCALSGGSWLSPYDNKLTSKPSDLDIDHVVPLAEAWRSGAWKWTNAQRQAYANDLSDSRALVAVSLSQNRAKGDKDVSNWLPAKNVCAYITNWLAVKYRYSLTIDEAESLVLNRFISTCGITNINVEILPEYSTYIESNSESTSPTISPSPSPTKSVAAILKMPTLPKPIVSEVANSSFEIRIPEIQGWDFNVMKLTVQITGTGAGDCIKESQLNSLPAVIKCNGVLANKIWIIGLRGNGEYGKVEPTQTFSESVSLSSYPSNTNASSSTNNSTTGTTTPSTISPTSTASSPTPLATNSPSPSSSSISWPANATAKCKDGTYSTSTSRSGTCSGHGGVEIWK